MYVVVFNKHKTNSKYIRTFYVQNVRFLQFLFTNLKIIQTYCTAKNCTAKKNVRHLITVCNFYYKFIQNHSTVRTSINKKMSRMYFKIILTFKGFTKLENGSSFSSG